MDAKKTPLNLYSVLYGDERIEVVGKHGSIKKRNRKQIYPSEKEEQILLATWLTKNGILFYHCPNGGRRNKIEAYELKRMGVAPGVPDICVPKSSKNWHGLYIEIKRRTTSLVSDAQLWWIDQLRKNGYRAEVAKGFEEAKAIVIDYFAT